MDSADPLPWRKHCPGSVVSFSGLRERETKLARRLVDERGVADVEFVWHISLAIAARKLADERYDTQARRGSRYAHERLGEPKSVLTRNEIVDIGRR